MSDLERKPATYTYDPEANAAYIELGGPTPSGGVARTVPVDAMADFDADGNPLGVEIRDLHPDRERSLPVQSSKFHVQNMTSWLPYPAELAAEMTGRDETELRNLYGDTVMVRMGFGGPLELRWGGPGPNPADIEETRHIAREALNSKATPNESPAPSGETL